MPFLPIMLLPGKILPGWQGWQGSQWQLDQGGDRSSHQANPVRWGCRGLGQWPIGCWHACSCQDCQWERWERPNGVFESRGWESWKSEGKEGEGRKDWQGHSKDVWWAIILVPLCFVRLLPSLAKCPSSKNMLDSEFKPGTMSQRMQSWNPYCVSAFQIGHCLLPRLLASKMDDALKKAAESRRYAISLSSLDYSGDLSSKLMAFSDKMEKCFKSLQDLRSRKVGDETQYAKFLAVIDEKVVWYEKAEAYWVGPVLMCSYHEWAKPFQIHSTSNQNTIHIKIHLQQRYIKLSQSNTSQFPASKHP